MSDDTNSIEDWDLADLLGFKMGPASCECGGNTAWFFKWGGFEFSVGCICHTDLKVWIREHIYASLHGM